MREKYLKKMSNEKAYDHTLKSDMSVVRRTLVAIGAWPVPVTSSTSFKIFYKSLSAVMYFLFFITIIPPFLHFIIREKSAKQRVKLSGSILNSSLQFVKYTMLLYLSKDIEKGLNVVQNDWLNADDQDRQIFQSKTQIGRKLVILSVCFMFGGGLCFRTVAPLLKGKIVTADNVTIRPLPCPSYYIVFNEQASPYYEIIFVLQFFAGLLSYSVPSGVCGIAAFLVLHVCSQLTILAREMKEFTEEKDMNDEDVQRRLIAFVDRQTRIKEFLNTVQETMEYITLVEIGGSLFVVCIAAFCVIMEWENSNPSSVLACGLLVVSFTFYILIVCYIGQLLENESINIQLISITMRWYRLPIKTTRSLILVIATSSYPMKLVAGKMFDMSLTTFTDIMKLSFAYLNLLRRID